MLASHVKNKAREPHLLLCSSESSLLQLFIDMLPSLFNINMAGSLYFCDLEELLIKKSSEESLNSRAVDDNSSFGGWMRPRAENEL